MHPVFLSCRSAFCCLSVTLSATPFAVMAAMSVSGTMLPEGAGRAKFIELCANCHEMSIVVAQGRTRSEWGDMISTMVDRGAVVPDEDFAVIQQYLTDAFPPAPASSATPP